MKKLVFQVSIPKYDKEEYITINILNLLDTKEYNKKILDSDITSDKFIKGIGQLYKVFILALENKESFEYKYKITDDSFDLNIYMKNIINEFDYKLVIPQIEKKNIVSKRLPNILEIHVRYDGKREDRQYFSEDSLKLFILK